MRRTLFFLMLITFLPTITSGIVETGHRRGGQPELHIVSAVIFIVLCLVHIWLNRKAIVRYLGSKQEYTAKKERGQAFHG
jgi:hypothetical protein